MSKSFDVTVLHAFSRKNKGDGWLVDLTCELLEEAGISRERIAILALDPESFRDEHNVFRAPGEPQARLSAKLALSGYSLVAHLAGFSKIRELTKRSHALIGVGGGYLVADSFVRQFGVTFNHLAQLLAAAAHPGPTIYMPQSIGPLNQPLRTILNTTIQKLDRFWVRDDVSYSELDYSNVFRCPDLAVMKVASGFTITPQPSSQYLPPIIVARDLPNSRDYRERLGQLYRLLPDAFVAVQSDVPGKRSDRTFYQSLGWPDDGSLSDVLTNPSGPVVSVRLHGAMAALAAGRPTVHLAYERKGHGAFQDLGLDDWVHDARTFDPRLVADQINSLRNNPRVYWNSLSLARDSILESRKRLVADLSLLLANLSKW